MRLLAVRVLPGVALCLVVTVIARMLERAETAMFGRAWLEALVLAILVGTTIRSVWRPSAGWLPGIAFGAKTLLEVAVMLLGASLSMPAVMAAGPKLLVGIIFVVFLALGASYGLGRLLGLSRRMATLVACGNSICGNSAIAAVAPVIGATAADVAAAIAFTAVLGVVVVLILPLAMPLLQLSQPQYGILAGLTVYAVPQVLAATAPAGALAVQVGTLVKLVRVLMLGPVVLCLSLLAGGTGRRGNMFRLLPWFILGFLALAVARQLGCVPRAALAPLADVARLLTIIAMAALGLGTDMRVVVRAGGRVTGTVTMSLVALAAISLGLIRLIG
jgi:uncharacterized integral membrane protein (TIGR00698 family)